MQTRASALRGRHDGFADTGDVAGARFGRRISPVAADESDQIGDIPIENLRFSVEENSLQ